MYKVVISVCEEAPVLISTVPNFNKSLDDLKMTTDRIEQTMSAQMSRKKGITESLNQLKKALNLQIAKISSVIFVYANSTNNLTLRQQFNITTSTLGRMPHATRIATCTQMISDLRAAPNLLTEAGMPEEDVTRLENLLAEYKNLHFKPRQATVNNSMNTLELKTAFRLADKIIKDHLDRLSVFFKESDPSFYNKYRSARKIEDRGIRHSVSGDANVVNEPEINLQSGTPEENS